MYIKNILNISFYLFLSYSICQPCFGQRKENNSVEVSKFLKNNIDSLTDPDVLLFVNDHLYMPNYIKEYYAHSNYNLIWLNNKNLSDSLIYHLGLSYFDGLNPEMYHLSLLKTLLKDSLKEKDNAHLHTGLYFELLMTDAFISYVSDLYVGHIHSNNENTEWAKNLTKINFTDSLINLVNGKSIAMMLKNFTSTSVKYIQLKQVLKKLLDSNKISDSDCINRINANMERWRWLPHKMPQKYIMVNIADFTMDLIDSGHEVLNMKIIVGKKYTRTPLFYSKMTYLVLNPYWEIPTSIAKKEILPEVKKDAAYLLKNHIKILSSWEPDATEINPNTVNWDTITAGKLSYHFRQESGPLNALGRVKFIFPNKHNVYLHDTPVPELFSQTNRTFSHGCIRIEKPIELALYILKSDSCWDTLSLKKALNRSANRVITLKKPIYVFICYWTNWVNEDGELVTRPDIYEYDKRLEDEILQSYQEMEE